MQNSKSHPNAAPDTGDAALRLLEDALSYYTRPEWSPQDADTPQSGYDLDEAA